MFSEALKALSSSRALQAHRTHSLDTYGSVLTRPEVAPRRKQTGTSLTHKAIPTGSPPHVRLVGTKANRRDGAQTEATGRPVFDLPTLASGCTARNTRQDRHTTISSSRLVALWEVVHSEAFKLPRNRGTWCSAHRWCRKHKRSFSIVQGTS